MPVPGWYDAIFVASGIVGVAWLVWGLRIAQEPVPLVVELDGEQLRVSGAVGLRSEVRLRVRDIVGLERSGADAKSPSLQIARPGIQLPVAIGGAGAALEDLESILGRILDAMRSEPAREKELKLRWALSRHLGVGGCPMLFGVVYSILAVWLWQFFSDSLPPLPGTAAFPLIASAEALRAGEWHRLLTANFLHLSALHFVSSCMGLAILGRSAERFLGGTRMLLLMGVSGIAGVLAALTLGGSQAVVGASAMVHGLLGSAFWVWLRCPEAPVHVALTGFNWLFLAVFLLGELAMEQVSTTGHLGGVVAGFAMTAILMRGRTLGELVGLDPDELGAPSFFDADARAD